MSDDAIIRQLSTFTPDGSGLDRDAILFAAGKASVRPSQRWKALAAVLAASQLASLALLIAMRPEHALLPTDFKQNSPLVWEKPSPQDSSAKPDSTSYVVLRDRILNADGAFPPVEPVDTALPDEIPLRAFGPLPSDLFN